MKKVIRLTESDLMRIVKRVITESLEVKIKDPKITNQIKNDLGVADLTSGKFVKRTDVIPNRIEIRHPQYDVNKKSILILVNNSGIADSGTWSINGYYISYRRN